MTIFFFAVIVLNVLWFSAAFHYFALNSTSAAKVLVAPSSRESPLFTTVSAAVRFLGGMNLALALLAFLLLFPLGLAESASERALFCFVFAVAHGSQFYFNVPIALNGGRNGESLWPVLSGPIFSYSSSMLRL